MADARTPAGTRLSGSDRPAGSSPFSVVTKSGMRINLEDPQPSEVLRSDVIAGLSGTCRFAAQTEVFYSVAQHTIMVADLVQTWLGEGRHGIPEELFPAVFLAALHHDSHEAFMSDLPAPVKRMLPGYEELSERLDRAVHEALGLSLDLDGCGARTLIDRADMTSRCVEAEEIIPRASKFILEHAGRPEPEDLALARSLWRDPLLPPAARSLFIETEERIYGQLVDVSASYDREGDVPPVRPGIGVTGLPLLWFSQDPI
jgi:hypothetical protein